MYLTCNDESCKPEWRQKVEKSKGFEARKRRGGQHGPIENNVRKQATKHRSRQKNGKRKKGKLGGRKSFYGKSN